MSNVDDVLEHFGVKGMHWGVRKKAAKEASSSDDAKAANAAQAKIKSAGGTHALSNQELKSLVERMNLEKQFKSLQPPTKSAAASKFAAELVLNVGKQQITRLASDAVTKQVAKAMGNK